MTSMLAVSDRKRACLFGLFVADATAMPVHWYYDINKQRRDYGIVTKYMKPNDYREGSILSLSNTGGGGRGSDQGNIVGTVILHGKKKYWARGGNFHYHLGLEAGSLINQCIVIQVYYELFQERTLWRLNL